MGFPALGLVGLRNWLMNKSYLVKTATMGMLTFPDVSLEWRRSQYTHVPQPASAAAHRLFVAISHQAVASLDRTYQETEGLSIVPIITV